MWEVDHFRRHVVRSADKCVALPEDEPRETHITKFRIALPVQQHILGLDISVDDIPLMHVLQCADEARHVEGSRGAPGRVLRKELCVTVQQLEQRATKRCLKEEVHRLGITESPIKADDEGAVHHQHELALPTHVALAAVPLDRALRDYLEGVPLAVCHTLHELYRSIGTAPQGSHHTQVRELDLLLAAKLGGPPVRLCRAPPSDDFPLAPVVNVRPKARNEAVPVLEDPLEQRPRDFEVEDQAAHSVGTGIQVNLRRVLVTQQRPFAKVRSSPDLPMPQRLPLAILIDPLPRHDRGTGPNDVPLPVLPDLTLLQDALSGAKLDEATCIARQLPELRAHQGSQGMHLFQELAVLLQAKLPGWIETSLEMQAIQGVDNSVLRRGEVGPPLAVVERGKLAEALARGERHILHGVPDLGGFSNTAAVDPVVLVLH
mmetsp:Transcript_64211/g.184526  ORF Transcript_64211/g.184526 Transcript_64211/m.184526 type:complete len:432 (-) Transcript_64211:1120-2415(-)